jgi:hypothetical protein
MTAFAENEEFLSPVFTGKQSRGRNLPDYLSDFLGSSPNSLKIIPRP